VRLPGRQGFSPCLRANPGRGQFLGSESQAFSSLRPRGGGGGGRAALGALTPKDRVSLFM